MLPQVPPSRFGLGRKNMRAQYKIAQGPEGPSPGEGLPPKKGPSSARNPAPQGARNPSGDLNTPPAPAPSPAPAPAQPASVSNQQTAEEAVLTPPGFQPTNPSYEDDGLDLASGFDPEEFEQELDAYSPDEEEREEINDNLHSAQRAIDTVAFDTFLNEDAFHPEDFTTEDEFVRTAVAEFFELYQQQYGSPPDDLLNFTFDTASKYARDTWRRWLGQSQEDIRQHISDTFLDYNKFQPERFRDKRDFVRTAVQQMRQLYEQHQYIPPALQGYFDHTAADYAQDAWRDYWRQQQG